MLVPLVTVSLIGLFFGLRAPESLGSQAKAVRIALVGAWIAYIVGALFGLVVDLVMFGGFWHTLIGHIAAVFGAKAAIEGEIAGRSVRGASA